jgi:hypothetical protein
MAMQKTGVIVRRWGRNRNPLRRGSDRVEKRCAALLLLMLLVAGPALAWWAGRATYVEDVRVRAWESRHRFAVQAVLLEPGAPAGVPEDTGRVVAKLVARARWTAPDGSRLTGNLPVAAGVAAGTVVSIWIDEHGTLAGPPTRRIPEMEAGTVAAAVLLGVATVLAGLRAVLLAALDRHRMRTWETEWLRVEPSWSRHR